MSTPPAAEPPQAPDYWRELGELSQSRDFISQARREMAQPLWWDEDASRRSLLKMVGSTAALASLAPCRRPAETTVPCGRASGADPVFATAVPIAGYARGVLATTRQGRPVKLDGNPRHPDSLGAADAPTQAALQELYDPDRGRAVSEAGRPSSYEAFLAALEPRLARHRERSGAGLSLLTGTVTSPAAAGLLERLLAELPEARWHSFEPLEDANGRAGARIALGREVDLRHKLGEADVVLSLDCDFLMGQPASLRHAAEFAGRRQPPAMNRLYVAEGMPSHSGAMADHRLALPAGGVERLARALAHELGVGIFVPALPEAWRRWIVAAARDLKARPGRGLVLVGASQPPWVHSLGHAVNERLGAIGNSLFYTDPVDASRDASSLAELGAELRSGRVETLLVLGGNPGFDAPADLLAPEDLSRAPFSARLGLYADETSERCLWHVPQAHALETWGDARSSDGTATILQPLLAPLGGGISELELLSAVAGEPATAHETVRRRWAGVCDEAWESALSEGLVPGTEFPVRVLRVRPDFLAEHAVVSLGEEPSDLELAFKPDPRLWDGRYANNPWLQELPEPQAGLAWDNAAYLSPADARRRALESGDEVELRRGGAALLAPVFVLPGHAEGSVTVRLGHGRRRAGRVGTGVGFDAYPLRRSDAPWFGGGLELHRTGRKLTLAGARAREAREPLPSLCQPQEQGDYVWGMAVNRNACIGCGSCIIACQAENNTPVVGREALLEGRGAPWIRVDRLGSAPESSCFQPVPCRDRGGSLSAELENCTYCVQRINAAGLEAKRGERRIADGEVRTACQAACPTQAILFGDVLDAGSKVSRATVYLTRLRNLNPRLES